MAYERKGDTVVEALTATIANGAALSGAVDLKGRQIIGLITPAGWTSAAVTFSVSYDGSTYVDLFDKDGEVSLTDSTVIGADRMVALDPVRLLGARYVKVRSGTAASPTNQGAERVFSVLTRSV